MSQRIEDIACQMDNLVFSLESNRSQRLTSYLDALQCVGSFQKQRSVSISLQKLIKKKQMLANGYLIVRAVGLAKYLLINCKTMQLLHEEGNPCKLTEQQGFLILLEDTVLKTRFVLCSEEFDFAKINEKGVV